MSNMLSIGFNYNKCKYDALIRLKESDGKKRYFVTVMNGELEKMLYGSHIFIEAGGNLQIADGHYCEEVLTLRKVIGQALSDYLRHFSLL